MSEMPINKSVNRTRFVLAAVLVVGAFFGAYQFAAARSNQSLTTAQTGAAGATQAFNDPNAAAQGGSGAGGAGCACCGSSAPTEGGVTGDKVEGAAQVTGDVQKVDVDVSSGIYNPNVIKLKAGVPAEITFSQASGCTAQVMSQDLGFFEDLSGGPKTVKLGALQPGEYAFSCGMQMVFGKIIVE